MVFASGRTKLSISEALPDFVFTKYFEIDCSVHLCLLCQPIRIDGEEEGKKPLENGGGAGS